MYSHLHIPIQFTIRMHATSGLFVVCFVSPRYRCTQIIALDGVNDIKMGGLVKWKIAIIQRIQIA